MSLIWKAVLGLAGFALLFGILLAVAYSRFKVETDPRVDEVMDAIPGSNCGACGYPGCQSAAEAVVAGKAPIDVCIAGGQKVARDVARIMGVPLETTERGVALVHCRGGVRESRPKALYQGISSCAAASKISGGGKACRYGCLGLGTCRDVCPAGAISFDDDMRRQVNRDKCTGCGLCVEVCPRRLIQVVPRRQRVLVVCNNRDKALEAKRVCSVSCFACKKCEKACEYDAAEVRDNRLWIDSEKCTQCGRCIEVCPNGVIVRVEPAKPGKLERKVRRRRKETKEPAGV